jgi:hypothetical protein
VKYSLAVPAERKDARDYFVKLMESEKKPVIEIVKVSPKRSLNQNSYLHLLLGYFGLHFGYTIEETKQVYKQVSRDIYTYKKNDTIFIRSSADLTTEEMAKTIDAFMKVSAENGCELPPATDEAWLRSVSNQIEREGLQV